MARRKASGPTDREVAILGVLWEKGTATVREVHEALHQDVETGYTTTLKLMQIMVEKGLLVREDDRPKRGMGLGSPTQKAALGGPFQPMRHRQDADATREQGQDALATKEGRQDTRDTSRRGHIYRPALSEEKTQKQLVADLLDRVFAGSAEKLVLRALSARKISPKELRRIREMLDEMEGA